MGVWSGLVVSHCLRCSQAVASSRHPDPSKRTSELVSQVRQLVGTRIYKEILALCPTGPTLLTSSGIPFQKIHLNCFSTRNNCRLVPRSALFLAAARLNHSCCPNAKICFDSLGTQHPWAVVRAASNIAIGEEVCISYIPFGRRLRARRQILQQSYDFVCLC